MATIKTKASAKAAQDKLINVLDSALLAESTAPTLLALLQEAHNIVYGDHKQLYENHKKNLDTIAKYWSTHLSITTGENITLTVGDVCDMMMLLKLERLVSNPNSYDSLLDIAGYAGLYDRVKKSKDSE
jgi:hypothetical protein